MWQRYLWVFCLAACASGVAWSEPVRVMSFNMLCGACAPIGYGGWDERDEGLRDTLQRARPDLLAAQEMMVRQNIDTVTHTLPRLEPHYLDRGMPHYDSVLFFDRERFELLDKGAFWLSRTPDAVLGFGWTVSLPRSVAWLRLKDRKDGAEFYFVGTHMDNNRANKQPSAELIRRRLAEFKDLPIILAGDFNVKPASHFTRTLTAPFPDQRGFIDSFDIAHDLVPVANAPIGWEYGCTDDIPNKFPDCRIDHIFLSGNTSWSVERYGIDMSRYGWRNQFISDHRPVWAEVNWAHGKTLATSDTGTLSGQN